MTHTTQVEWHEDRPLVHFGSPPSVKYWKPEKPEKPKKAKHQKRKKGKK